MIHARLLICVVRRSRGDRVVELVRSAGATGSTVLLGRGTANSRLLRFLCLGDTEKELVFTIAPAEKMSHIIETLRAAPDLCRKVPGIAFTIDVTSFWNVANPNLQLEAMPMQGEAAYQLVCVIANAGFAYDIMGSARAAGATGGTILKARGTGSEEDGTFFGITIVPEKDMIMILSPRAKVSPIVEAIRACPCIAEPGSGIVFCMPVQEFFTLGAKGA